jgi:hypothetical protein
MYGIEKKTFQNARPWETIIWVDDSIQNHRLSKIAFSVEDDSVLKRRYLVPC